MGWFGCLASLGRQSWHVDVGSLVGESQTARCRHSSQNKFWCHSANAACCSSDRVMLSKSALNLISFGIIFRWCLPLSCCNSELRFSSFFQTPMHSQWLQAILSAVIVGTIAGAIILACVA